MPRNILYNLISVLTKPEMEEAAAYLGNPHNGAKKHHVLCFAAIKKSREAKAGLQGLTNEKLFANSFGKMPYNDRKLRQLKSDTCRLIEDFLVTKQMKANEPLRSELLASALAQRKDYDLFKETVSKRIKKLNGQNEKGKSFYRELASLYNLLYYHPETEKLDKNSDFLQQHIENIENCFIISYLENGSESLLKKRVINAEEQLSLMDAVSIAAEKRKILFPAIHSFLMLYHIYENNKLSPEINLVKKHVIGSLKFMSKSEKQMALKLLTQHVNSSKEMKKNERENMLFELYKKSVDNGFSKSANGIIDPNHFINVAVVAAKVREFAWAFDFLNKKHRYLPKGEKAIVEKICLGSIYFQRGSIKKNKTDLKKALSFLQPIPSRCHEKYNLRMRTLSVRLYYELHHRDGDFEMVEKETQKFIEYLFNNTALSEMRRMGYIHFLEKLNSLCELHIMPNKKSTAIDQYLKELLSGEKFPLHDWLIKKAEELKASLRF